ncbi:MAG TPA: tRNA lysidine(34) synthetase TilS [bacterium]|nr:tRNA lysidine(34) synthetase TilS [bacterium]
MAPSRSNLPLTLPAAPFGAKTRLLVALSGGADSTALLALLSEQGAPRGLRLFAAHVNYGLRGRASQKDEDAVRALCAKFKVPLRVLRLTRSEAAARREKKSLQDWARERRYAFFARACRQTRSWGVAVAHQAEDQAETILDRLLRGAGLKGLTGLRPLQALTFPRGGTVRVWRPLLSFTKGELERYLRSQGLPWREDLSNRKTHYRRNQIRRQLLPYLAKWNPQILRALLKLGEVAAAQEAFMMQALERASRKMGGRFQSGGWSGRQASFRRMPLAIQRLLLRQKALDLHPAARGLSFDRLEEGVAVWRSDVKGPRDLGYALSVGVDRGQIWMRRAKGPKSS